MVDIEHARRNLGAHLSPAGAWATEQLIDAKIDEYLANAQRTLAKARKVGWAPFFGGVGLLAAWLAFVTLLFWFLFPPAHARPNERWAQASPERQEFFKSAKMPDSPRVSCCGKADAYEADDIDDDGHGNIVAILTCNDPDNCVEHDPICDEEGDCYPRPLPGARILIPVEKVMWPHEPDNLTGHGWVFLSAEGRVYCYAFPALY